MFTDFLRPITPSLCWFSCQHGTWYPFVNTYQDLILHFNLPRSLISTLIIRGWGPQWSFILTRKWNFGPARVTITRVGIRLLALSDRGIVYFHMIMLAKFIMIATFFGTEFIITIRKIGLCYYSCYGSYEQGPSIIAIMRWLFSL
jgi:hypothetical protein